jgi:hypothetical protein
MRELLNSHLLEVAAAKIVPALAGIGFVAISARYFAAHAYGDFSLAFAQSSLLSVISVVWISQSVLRFAGSGVGNAALRPMIAVATGCVVLTCVANVALPGLWRPSSAPTTVSPMWQVPLLSMALAMNVIAGAYATALQRFRAYRVAEVSRGGLMLLLVAAFALLDAGDGGLILAYSLGTLVPSITLIHQMGRTTAPSAQASVPMWNLVRQFMRYGWPMTLWAALQASQALIERKVLGASLPAADFGRFMATTDVVVRGIGLALMPIVTYVHAKLMSTAGHSTQLGPNERRLLFGGVQLIAIGGCLLTVAVLSTRSLLVHIAPGIAQLDNFTLVMLCTTATLWALALIAHKPLELAKQPLRMCALLGATVGIQWMLLLRWVESWREMAMPMASSTAAVIYLVGCMLLARQNRTP